MSETLEGPRGSAYSIDPPAGHPTLATWIIHAPEWHPVWSHYVLVAITLRDMDGWPPAERDYPEAEWQFTVLALNPKQPLPVKDGDPVHFLTPGNVQEQFNDDAIEDDDVVDLARSAVRAVLDGRLIPEPSGIRGAREAWGEAIAATIAHMKGLHDE